MKPNILVVKLFFTSSILAVILSSCLPQQAVLPAPPTSFPATPPLSSTDTPIPPTITPTTLPTVTPTQLPSPTPTMMGPSRGGRLVLAETGGFNTLDPFISAHQATPQYAVFDTILALKPDLSQYVGSLVEDKWEPAPDNLSVVFHVKNGIHFQDGTAVDAPALKWNLDQYADPKIGSPAGAWMDEYYAGADTPDPLTLKIRLKKPYASLYSQLQVMEMASPGGYQALGPQGFAQNPPGSGPWVVKAIHPNESILYSRSENYAWEPAGIYQNQAAVWPEELQINFYNDPEKAFAQLQNGVIDVLPNLPQKDVDAARSDPNIQVIEGEEYNITYLGFNTQFPPFDDPKFRLAISYTIDRDALIQVGFQGKAIPQYSSLNASEMGYSQEMEDYAKSKSNDIEKAKQLLASLGYVPGTDGILLAHNNIPLEFTLTTTPDGVRKQVAEAIQAQLLQVGIRLKIDIKDTQVVKEMTQKGTHQMILWGYGLIDPYILTYLFHSNRLGTTNRTRYVNPDLDRLLEAADAALDWPDRQQKVADVLRFLVDQRPSIPLYSQYTYSAYRKDRVAGLVFDKLAQPLLLDAYMLAK